jgi:hypothetical protein
MTTSAIELLAELDTLGVDLTVDGDTLKIDAPAGVLTDDLRQAIKENKAEIISLLRKLEQARVERLLNEYGWVAIYSEALNETVLWCRDERVIIPTRWRGAVKYTLRELQTLTSNPSLNAEGLKRIHRAKKEFQGKVIPVQDPSR